MKRIIVTANPESIRAYRIDSEFLDDHFEFGVSEIEFSPESKPTPRSSSDVEHRLKEMAREINSLVTTENPDSWVFAAPLSILVNLLPLVERSVRNRLSDAKIGDLTGLPTTRIARRFAPSKAAA
jgi:hypothetical protein